jgi:hypothetical protein
LKLPLFCVLILLTIINLIKYPNCKVGSRTSNIIVISFLSIGVISVFIGYLLNIDFDLSFGISKLYSLMFLILIYVMIYYNFDYCKAIINVLMLLNLFIIIIAVIYMFNIYPSLIDKLYAFGNKYSAFTVNTRSYGDINFCSIYFHSSPMLVLAIAYYSYKFIYNTKKIKYIILYLIAFLGMFLTGSRNNMIFAILISIAVWLVYSKKKSHIVILSVIAVSILLIFNKDVIISMFSTGDASNNTKIQTVIEYFAFFNENPITLLLGQGIGGTILSPIRGNIFITISELSYLDILRWFGLFGGLVVLILMFYPLINIIKCKQKNNYWIAIAYGAFLTMIILNPFFFNSVGITIYAIIVTKFIKSKEAINNF